MSCVLPRENATVSRGTVYDDEGHLIGDHLEGFSTNNAYI